MTDEKTESEPTLVERWLADQQAWQKTALAYLDSMVNNEEFLVHLGNAMRGSLLAGRPYPTAPPPGAAEPLNETEGRIDEVLHALHLVQGELRDLRAAVDRIDRRLEASSKLAPRTRAKSRSGRVKPAAKPAEPESATAAQAKDGDAA